MQARLPFASTLTLAVLAAVSARTWAADFDYALRAGLSHNDNINLSDTDATGQYVLTPGLDFTFRQQGSVLQANVAGNMEYRDYLGNAFDNQTLTQLSTQANWTVLPERLDFAVEDYASVEPLSTLSSNTPNNQQQTNVLALGPILHFRMGPTLNGQAELRYINSNASKTQDFDSSRSIAALRLLKDLSPTSQLSANADTQRVAFRHSDANPDYDRSELYARYVRRLDRFNLDGMLGWSRIDFERAPNATSPLLRLNTSWQATLQSTLTVEVARQFSDAAQDLLERSAQTPLAYDPLTPARPLIPTEPNINTGNMVINSQVYTERRIELSYDFSGTRFAFRIAPLYRKVDYVNDTTFSQTGRGGSIGVDYRLSPRTMLSGFANTERLRYDSLARTDRTSHYSISLTEQKTMHWSWRVALTRDWRSSTVAGQGYQANEIYLGVIYRR